MSKLISSGSENNEYYYLYENTTIDSLAQQVHSFFQNEGYKLEEGNVQNGVYGTGSAFLRFLLGGFVKRNKFKIEIEENANRVRLSVRGAMSGFSGGLLGRSKMKNELRKITDKIKTNL